MDTQAPSAQPLYSQFQLTPSWIFKSAHESCFFQSLRDLAHAVTIPGILFLLAWLGVCLPCSWFKCYFSKEASSMPPPWPMSQCFNILLRNTSLPRDCLRSVLPTRMQAGIPSYLPWPPKLPGVHVCHLGWLCSLEYGDYWLESFSWRLKWWVFLQCAVPKSHQLS